MLSNLRAPQWYLSAQRLVPEIFFPSPVVLGLFLPCFSRRKKMLSGAFDAQNSRTRLVMNLQWSKWRGWGPGWNGSCGICLIKQLSRLSSCSRVTIKNLCQCINFSQWIRCVSVCKDDFTLSLIFLMLCHSMRVYTAGFCCLLKKKKYHFFLCEGLFTSWDWTLWST